jgi:hypothetical protein
MSNRMGDTFFDALTVLDKLSQSPDGMTVGQINKAMGYLTVGQVGRIVHSLGAQAFVCCEIQPHGRTGKKVYKMTERAAILCGSISRQYVECLS